MLLKIAIYILIVFVSTIALAVVQQKMQISFEKISLPQFAPAIGVLLFFIFCRNTIPSINYYFDKAILFKSLLAFAIPLVLFILTYSVSKLQGTEVSINENIYKMLPFALIGILLGAIGEEMGWRSFMQPLLEKKFVVLTASIVVGLIWGLWHIGHYKNGFIFMCGFLLFTISASIIIAWLLRNTEYNLIVSSIFHFSVNLGFLIFFYNSASDSKFMLTNGLIWLIFALGILITNRDFFLYNLN